MVTAAPPRTVTTSKAVWNLHAPRVDLLGRIAIMRDTGLEQFLAMLSGREIGTRRLRASALTAAKAVLGNSLYERLRAAILG